MDIVHCELKWLLRKIKSQVVVVSGSFSMMSCPSASFCCYIVHTYYPDDRAKMIKPSSLILAFNDHSTTITETHHLNKQNTSINSRSILRLHLLQKVNEPPTYTTK